MKLQTKLASQLSSVGYLIAVPAIQAILFILVGVVEFLTWIADLMLGQNTLDTIPAQILFSPIQHALLGIFYFIGMTLLIIWIIAVYFPKLRKITQKLTQTYKGDKRVFSIVILSVFTIISASVWSFLLLFDQNTPILLRLAMFGSFVYASYLSHTSFIQSLPKRLHAL